MRRRFSLAALLLLVTACGTEPTAPASLTPDDLQPSLNLSASPSGAVVDAGAHHACTFYPQDGNVNCFGAAPHTKGPTAAGWYGERADYLGGDAIGYASGDWTNCVLLATGNTHCWGESPAGYTYTGGDAIQMAVGYGWACVLTSARNVNCSWGGVWKQYYGGGDAEWVAMASYQACIKKADTNTLTCIGYVSEPQWVTTGTPTPQAGGHYAICMRMAEGTVDCMNNSYNEVGQTKVPVGLTEVVDLDGQFDRTCAALSNGDIKCWGRNYPESHATNQTWTYAGVGAVSVTVTYEDICYSTAAGKTACMRSTPDVYSGGAVRDATPPVISPTVSGTLGQNGWHTSDVTVSWETADGESTVSSSSGCDATTVSSDTPGASVTCKATSAGGSASKTVTVKRDATAPALAFSGNKGTYFVDQTVEIGCSASDATSGLAASDCPKTSGDAYTFALGSNTRSATAKDHAGNTAGASVDFTVEVNTGSLCTLTKRWVDKAGVAHSLCKQLENGAISAYQNHLSAQTGKSITAAHAEILHRLANGL